MPLLLSFFRAVNQVHGYQSFNCLRYSVLATQHVLHCLRRDDEFSSMLLVSDPIPLSGINCNGTNISYLTCWLFMLMSSHENGVYSSPAGTPIANYPNDLQLIQVNAPKQKLYELRTINSRQIHFTSKVIGKGAFATVVPGEIFQSGLIVFKLYDSFHDIACVEVSKTEVSIYKKLRSAQGRYIPKFYGYFNFHGIIILALEDCGRCLKGDEYPTYASQINDTIHTLGKLGFKHDDLKMRDNVYPNILINNKGEIRFIDFQRNEFEANDVEANDVEANAVEANAGEENDVEADDVEAMDVEPVMRTRLARSAKSSVSYK